MRLIDAGALMDRCIASAGGWFCHREITFAEALKMVCDMIDEADTIDAEPVVHARWEESEYRDEKYRCSACGGACWYYDYQGAVARSRFCPNCGAKMDGKEDGK